PILSQLFGYPLADNAQLNQSEEKVKINFKKQPDGSYLADTVYAAGSIGFGIDTYDRQDLAANKNGVYAIQQLVNGKVYSALEFESFSFSETRYINTLIDYDHFGKYRSRIIKCFRVPGNSLSIYKDLHNNGKIVVREGLSYKVDILITDLEGNTTKLIIPVEGRRGTVLEKKKTKITDEFVLAKKPNNYDLGAATVYFPPNTFYEDFYIDFKKGRDTVTIHNNQVAAHRNFTITFDVSKYTEQEKKQLFIARLDKKLRPSYASTYKRGNTFTTRTRNLGTYTLVKDTLAPIIRAKNFKEKQWLNNYRYLSLYIADDLSGIDSYSATLNGEWILMEYEPKRKTLTYNFDDIILDKTQCEFKLVVTDNVGNTTTFSRNFYRK
ncbi:MAG: M23 family peptidase, partial [Eudoraea sp.]|nr:M23 family peptidase [Eudoraea sp.]